MITSERHSDASPAIIHELLVDVDSWRLWAPHIASIESSAPRIEVGWAGRTRAFFAPLTTSMVVDDVFPDGGYDWHSTLGPWKLRYQNRVEPAAGNGSAGGSTIRFAAGLDGPLSVLLQAIVSPLSAYGQRRRMRRLAQLADVVERRLDPS